MTSIVPASLVFRCNERSHATSHARHAARDLSLDLACKRAANSHSGARCALCFFHCYQPIKFSTHIADLPCDHDPAVSAPGLGTASSPNRRPGVGSSQARTGFGGRRAGLVIVSRSMPSQPACSCESLQHVRLCAPRRCFVAQRQPAVNHPQRGTPGAGVE